MFVARSFVARAILRPTSQHTRTLLPATFSREFFWRAQTFQDLLFEYKFSKAQKLVGKDLQGNKYFVYRNHPTGPIVRMVDYAEEVPDPENLPVEGWAWLMGRRDEPPSIEELEVAALNAAAFQEKVKKMEEYHAAQKLSDDQIRRNIDENEGPAKEYEQTMEIFATKQYIEETREAAAQEKRDELAAEQAERDRQAGIMK